MILSTAPIGKKNSGLVRQLLPQARVFVWEQEEKSRALPALLKKISRAFLSASNTAPRELERRFSRRQSAASPGSHCRFTKNRRAFLFYQREGFTVAEEKTDPATGEIEYQMLWEKG